MKIYSVPAGWSGSGANLYTLGIRRAEEQSKSIVATSLETT